MSFKEMSDKTAIVQQVRFKLAAFSLVFSTLAIIQLIAFLFSITGSQSSGGMSDVMVYQVTEINSNLIVIFTLLWALAIPFGMLSRDQRQMEFMFVTNRFVSHVSNLVFIVWMALVAAFFTVALTLTLHVTAYVVLDDVSVETILSLSDLAILWLFTGLWVLLIATTSYSLAVLMRLHTLLKVIGPAVVLGLLFYQTPVAPFIEWIVLETTIAWFALKVLLTVSVISLVVVFGIRQLEVRR
ncbi:hypothetical protein ABID56_002214 [Alkalibacillus flavidus]|uniref:ABC transporter permease n=1 Tax=Alkalibacillus flavidus TaxID=546021 RepID=A0ABV2KWY7_9BACI